MPAKGANPVEDAENWKAYIRSEDDSGRIWQHMWGWIMDEYRELKKKLDQKTKESVFLSGVMEEVKEDPRKLIKVPESVNHEYGWVAVKPEFQLQIYGSDYFKPKPLPDVYKLIK
ncbi:hypothetical protein NQ318_000349 [Aromia moschata]|uniref:Uncharacterized protein n=1 Tax=Aromia moschata TaxID=1265417 RepID=A0AAV8XUX8_9CUCU|nr:hypothetical protein NQ318_000349 [Aromia moschata]